MKFYDFLKLLTEVGWNKVEYTLVNTHNDYGEVLVASTLKEVFEQLSTNMNLSYAEYYDITCINFM